MICCTPTIIPFNNVPSVAISYPASMIAAYGPEPNVQVFYKEGLEYVLSDDMNAVVFDGSTITVDNGGPNTGVIKIF